MCSMQTLSIEKREGGKAAALRRTGRVPISIQGGGTETMLASADAVEVRRVLAASHGQKMMIKLGTTKSFEVLVRGSDFDAAKGQLLALSLQRVSENDIVKIEVPVVVDGEPQSVTDGHSTLSISTTSLELKGALHDIPEEIHVDASQLGEHDKLLAGDVVLPKGVTLQTSPDAVVASTSVNRAFVEAGVEAADEASAAASTEEAVA
ncbi:50S ribosomal protein L25/general stress protein Ctc [soil metagenome]